MIYFVSDTHGGENMGEFETFKPDKGDLIIHLGDVGIFWDNSPENRRFTEWFLSREYEMAFIDGNHENFDELLKFPEETWHGGKVHRIAKNLVHLMRGQIYEIEGKTFFTMGGCVSSNHWKAEKPWWVQECPTAEEFETAYNALSRGSVDYVLTHKYFPPDKRTGKEDRHSVEALHGYIDENVSFKKWYSGHWHSEYDIDEKHKVLFTSPVGIE